MRDDIIQLLRESEEFGRQHVFLFRCPKADVLSLTNEAEIRKRLEKMDIESLFTVPRVVEMPRGLQLVDVRLEPTPKGSNLIIKG
jgi:hypothetical protein